MSTDIRRNENNGFLGWDDEILTLSKVLMEESIAVAHVSAKRASSVLLSRAYLMRYSK